MDLQRDFAAADTQIRLAAADLQGSIDCLAVISAPSRPWSAFPPSTEVRGHGHRQPAGLTFWFRRKKLVGSYFFFSAASRSYSPAVDCSGSVLFVGVEVVDVGRLALERPHRPPEVARPPHVLVGLGLFRPGARDEQAVPCAPLTERRLVPANAAHGTAELFDGHHAVRRRGGGEATGNRVDRRIAQVLDEAGFPVVEPAGWGQRDRPAPGARCTAWVRLYRPAVSRIPAGPGSPRRPAPAARCSTPRKATTGSPPGVVTQARWVVSSSGAVGANSR